MVLARIEPFSAGRVVGSVYALLGLVIGSLITVFALFGAFADMSSEPGMGWLAPLFGIAAIVVLPILYGGMAFVMAALVSFLYNVVAARIGGIEIGLRE